MVYELKNYIERKKILITTIHLRLLDFTIVSRGLCIVFLGQFSLISYSLGILHVLQCAGFRSHFWPPIFLGIYLKSLQVLLPGLRVGERVFLEADLVVNLVPDHHDRLARTTLAQVVLHFPDLLGPGSHHRPEETGGGVSLDSVLKTRQN